MRLGSDRYNYEVGITKEQIVSNGKLARHNFYGMVLLRDKARDAFDGVRRIPFEHLPDTAVYIGDGLLSHRPIFVRAEGMEPKP